MQFEIRAFLPEDLEQLHQIREAAFAPVFQSFRALVGEEIAPIAFAHAEKEQADYLNTLCEPGEHHRVYVALAKGALCGFVAVKWDPETKVGEIDLNAVHPDNQGEGVGLKLYEFALEVMRQNGMVVASVGTGGDESHTPARRTYEKAGFSRAVPSIYMYRTL